MSSYQLASPDEEPLSGWPTSEAPGPWAERILVVDDESGIRIALGKALRQEGYLIDVTADGEQAWQAIQGRRYACFLVDLKMPRLSGRELYKRVVTMDKRLARKFILMTGDTLTEGIGDFIAPTGNPLIEKPFDLGEVRRQVRRVLEAESGDDQIG